jgi:hypothetical protein
MDIGLFIFSVDLPLLKRDLSTLNAKASKDHNQSTMWPSGEILEMTYLFLLANW